MRYSLNLFLPCLLLAMPAGASPDKTNELPCSTSDASCAETAAIAVYGSQSGVNDGLVATATTAKQDFFNLFGRSPSPTMIVPGGTISAELRGVLNARGYSLLLPWVSALDRIKLREASVRKQIDSQLEGQPDAIRSAALQQALSALGSSPEPSDESIELGALTHELSHLWFIDAFRRDGTALGGHSYGGWAPDWLDETAAVLLENEILKTRRRARFAEMDENQRIPLAEFLTMDHPSAKAARDLTRGDQAVPKTGETRTIVLSGEEAEKFIAASGGNRAVDFYAQVLVFSDYLNSRTGSKTTVATIAAALSDGESFEAWLSTNGVGLPKDMTALDLDWLGYSNEL